MNLAELKNLNKNHLILKNINGDSLGIIQSSDISLNLRYNGISELQFTVYKDFCPYYDLITSYRRMELQGLMKFIIEKPQIFGDGANEYKVITCRSFEIDINRKSIPYLSGTYKFYSIDPEEETIIKIIMSHLPNWVVESVDLKLWNIYRTFDLTDKALYEFMMNECSQAYECVFEFDTISQTIKVKAYENIPKKTDIYLSYNNLVQELGLTEKTEDLYTALDVYGANDLSINIVNPLGNSTIYNFSHFLNQEGFLSNGLKQAILNWQELIDIKQLEYSDYLTQRRNELSELITLEAELIELQNDLKALEIVRDALLESGLNATAKNTEIKGKRTEISNKENAINNKKNEISNIDNLLNSIQNTLAFDKYFTSEQLKEIEPIVIHTSITDDNFITVSTDTELDKQTTAQDLYDKYKRVIDNSSQLKYEFSTNLIDFINIDQYNTFTNQLQWGSQVTIAVEDKKKFVYPMLLGLDIVWGESIDIQYLFSTEVRLTNSLMNFDDFSMEASNISNKMAGDSIKWGEYVNSGVKDTLFNIFRNGLNADLVEVKNAYSQEVLLNATGLMGRKLLEHGLYSDEQWKFINNKLLFTDDNWNTAKLAAGKITLPDGSTAYGLNTEVLMGTLIAGNQLIIKNAANTFLVDENGAKLKNAELSVENDQNKILLDPDNGFKIQKKQDSVWLDNFYVDIDGNVKFKGDIFGGTMNINNKFTVDSTGKVNILSGRFNIADLFTVEEEGTVSIKKGSFNISDMFTVAEDGTVSIKKGNLNINNNFIVDTNGNVVMRGILNIADKLLVDSSGNLILHGGSIKWASSDPSIAIAQASANNALSVAQNAQSSANTAYSVATLAGTNISKLSNGTYSGGTFIDGKRIEAPEIYGGKIQGIDMIGSYFRGSTANSAYLTLGVSKGGNYGDLQLHRGDGELTFSIYDNLTRVDLKSLGITFLASDGNKTYPEGVWNFNGADEVDFTGTNVTGVVAKFA